MATIAREWEGETAFVLAGGASVAGLDPALLKGNRVVAINSAWRTYPAADALFFADIRWWREIGAKGFAGRVVTTSPLSKSGQVDTFQKTNPDKGVSRDPGKLALRRSSVTGAINWLLHQGVRRIGLLGVDGKLAADGRRHHHPDRYPWAMVKGCFDEHALEFNQVAPSIAAAGVEVVNCNPDSAITAWPKMTLGDFLVTDPNLPKPAAPPVRIFVGCSANGEDAESQAVLEYSIRSKASLPVEITWMKHSHDPADFWHGFASQNWKTPFSGFRWAVSAACGYEGRAIYMDSDVIVLADIAELWNQPMNGYAVLAKSGGRLCVSLWDCAAAKKHVLPLDELRSNPEQHHVMQMRTRANQNRFLGVFQGEWNCLDGAGFTNLDDLRLKAIHYTEMSCQLHLDRAIARLDAAGQKHWMDGQRYPHPRKDLQALFNAFFIMAEANGYTVDRYVPAPEQMFGEYRKASLANYAGGKLRQAAGRR